MCKALSNSSLRFYSVCWSITARCQVPQRLALVLQKLIAAHVLSLNMTLSMAMSVKLYTMCPHYSLPYWCEAFAPNQLRNSSPFLIQESEGFNFQAALKLNTSMLIDVSRSLTWWLGVINLYWWEWQSSRFEISGLQTSLLKPIVSQIKYCIQLSH